MKLTWLGHGSFRLDAGGQSLLIDPWFTGNPVFPQDRKAEAVEGATHIAITHGHGDHATDAVALARELGLTIYGMNDLMVHWAQNEEAETVGFNKGGTVDLGGVALTLVNAVHSSSMPTSAGPMYCGSEAGFMIGAEGKTIYLTGDTDIMADMEWMGEFHAPDIGILCAGGHYTMDMKRATWAAKRYFDFKTVIPCHYKTFPLLEQSAEAMIAGLPGVDVIEPEVMVPIEL